MKREFLKELGLEDAVIDKIMDENGKDIEKHKGEADTAKTSATQLKTQLEDANKQIEAFKGMDIDGIKAAADDYKAKYEESEKKHAAELAKIARTSAAEKFVDTLKPKDALSKKAILAEFESKDFKLENDSFIGAKEWAEQFVKDNASHFDDGKPAPGIFQGGSGGGAPTGKRAELEAIANDMKKPLIDRVAARNQLSKLESEG